MIIDNKGSRMAFFVKNNQGVEKQFILTEGITQTDYNTYFLALVCNKNFPITIKLTEEEVGSFRCVRTQEECDCLKTGKISFIEKTSSKTVEKVGKENVSGLIDLKDQTEHTKENGTENTGHEDLSEETTETNEKKRRGRKKQE